MALRMTVAELRAYLPHTPLPLLTKGTRFNPHRAARSRLQPSNLRFLSQTSASKFPRKDSQDRNSINTEATEYSKSGTDDQTARNEDAAFDPDKTSPEEQRGKAGEGNEKEPNPLDVSPANPEVSKQRPEQEGGAEKTANKDSSGGRSGGSSPNKGKKLGE